MDITALRTFLAAAETGSFSGAAQRVHISPSSVTERIKQLEHRFGAKLFVRDRRGCTLTQAGEKLVAPATQTIRSLDIARHEISLPEQYTRSISIGGQYVLWDHAMLNWLEQVRLSFPDLALRVTSGASARLNRDLGEGFLDFTILYDPIFRRDIASQPVFEDELVLVAGGDLANWRHDYVRIEWGRAIGAEIASRLDLAPETGLVLDLGGRSADWLIARRMAGYMPLRSVRDQLASGELQRVPNVPTFPFSGYACWRRDLDPELAVTLVDSLKAAFAPS